jgi:hypothetical protein
LEVRTFPGNPCDGQTLCTLLKQASHLTQDIVVKLKSSWSILELRSVDA